MARCSIIKEKILTWDFRSKDGMPVLQDEEIFEVLSSYILFLGLYQEHPLTSNRIAPASVCVTVDLPFSSCYENLFHY